VTPRRSILSRSAALVLFAIVAASCGPCGCDDDHVAELAATERVVERDFSAATEEWRDAEVGARFAIGDGVRTGDSSEARVTLVAGGTLRMGPGSLVRFLASEGDRPVVGVEAGEADVTAGGAGVEIVTEEGRAILLAESVLLVRTEGGQRRFEVSVGEGVFRTRSGEEVRLAVGSGVVVSVGAGELLSQFGDSDTLDDPPADAAPGVVDVGPPELASVFSVEITGRNARVREGAEGRLARVGAGRRDLEAGSAIALGRGTTATVIAGDARTDLGAGASAVLGEDGSVVVLSRGATTAEAGATPVRVGVPGGTIVLRSGARATVRVDDDGATAVRATRGTARIVGASGRREVATGLRGYLSREGQARLERAPDRGALAVVAGISATIHDPRPPTAVDFLLSETACSEGVVEVGAPESPVAVGRGRGHTILVVRPGNHAYRVRCVESGELGEVAASGTLRVRRDAAVAPLPVTPPTSTVDSDGRRYTVQYQTLLPELTFEWSDAPVATSYTLTVIGPGNRTRTLRGPSPTQTLSSGELGHGSYRFHFETDGGRRSRDSHLRVGFDASASHAFLSDPDNGSFASGESVHVVGGAARGSTVTSHGETLRLDGRFRFRQAVVVPSAFDALTVKISHPTFGEHFYLRRARP